MERRGGREVGTAAANLPLPYRVGFPFTPAQWQELQRQALIYKHIMSSVPVPPVLLLSPTAVVGGQGGDGSGACYALRLTGRTDPEPGRCRRTDGKKWRCSRDVAAPDQKYCERHMHRGRPRSRKPVEPHKPKSAANTKTITATAAPPPPPPAAVFRSLETSTEPRYPNWMKGGGGGGGEIMAVAPPPPPPPPPPHHWGMMNSNVEGWLNLNYTDLNTNSSHCSFLSPLEADSLGGGDHRAASRSFIDAWSTETAAPTLTLSMPSAAEEEAERIQMGLGVSEYSMVKSPPQFVGGPLAEVLQSSTAASSPRHNAGSRSCYAGLIDLMGKSGGYGSHDEVISPKESPSRPASSPSGVLQKALVSLSDSSSCSSPTFAAAGGRARSEIALQWFN